MIKTPLHVSPRCALAWLLLLAPWVPARALAQAPAAAAATWQVQVLDGASQGTLLPGGGVRFSLPGQGRVLATQTVRRRFVPGETLRFSGRVEISGSGSSGRPAASGMPNGDAAGVCLAVQQRDARGRSLNNIATQPAGGDGATSLSLTFIIQPEAAELTLQCRAIDVRGQATFSGLNLAAAPLPPPAQLPQARILPNGHGGFRWQADGQELPWNFYFGNNQFGRDEALLSEIRQAIPAGVRVISFNLQLPCSAPLEDTEATLARFLDELPPDVYFIPRVWTGLQAEWNASHPEENLVYANGERVNISSPASKAWRQAACFNLEQLVLQIRRSRFASRFLGLIPLYYQTGEWVIWQPEKAEGFSEVMRRGFAGWLRGQYGSVAALNAAWGTRFTAFEQVQVPSAQQRTSSTLGLFRDPRRERAVIDYFDYTNALIPEVIGEQAAAIKRASGGRSLVGVFYGYTFEIGFDDHWPQQTGHLGLGRLLALPDIDFFGSSYSYAMEGRGFGLPMDYIGPQDSGPLHGKPTFIEEDFFTHLAAKPGPGVIAPGYESRTSNTTQTLAVLKRNLGAAVAHNQFIHWQSLLSDGRFDAPQIWALYARYRDLMLARNATRAGYAPQVAFVVDERGYLSQRVPARAVYGRWIYEMRWFFSRLDTTTGYYLQSDLGRLPDSVRCVVLLAPYALSAEQERALRERFARQGRMIVFCYLPGWMHEGRADAAGLSRWGIGLKLHQAPRDPESVVTADSSQWAALAGTHFGNRRDLTYTRWFPEARLPEVEPYCTVEDPAATPLARYVAGGEVSCALKQQPGGWTAVYLGTSRLEPRMWRELLRAAGCHLYLDDLSNDWQHPDVIQAADDFLMVQSGREGRRRVNLPATCRRVVRMDGVADETVGENLRGFEAEFQAGVPAFFRLER